MKYQTEKRTVLRGFESRTITKWTEDGWELISEDRGTLRSTLTFRRPKPPLPIRAIALYACAVIVFILIFGLLAIFADTDETQQEAQTSEKAPTASTSLVESPAESPTTITTLTVENNSDFAALLEPRTSECGSDVANFAEQYAGQNIEFDGYVAHIANHDSYETRFDILIYAGIPDPNHVNGPNFLFRNVNTTYDIKSQGDYVLDYVTRDQRLHIVAQVDKFEQVSCLFLLKPVATTFLE